MFASHYIGGVPKRRREAVTRELRILSENLLLSRAARDELEEELDAEPRAANARLAAENLRIGDDQIVRHCSSLKSYSSWTWSVLGKDRVYGERKTQVRVTWNGTELPAELRDLPPGRYVVEAREDEAPPLSPEEESGIEAALESYRQGRVIDAKRARQIIDATLER